MPYPQRILEVLLRKRLPEAPGWHNSLAALRTSAVAAHSAQLVHVRECWQHSLQMALVFARLLAWCHSVGAKAATNYASVGAVVHCDAQVLRRQLAPRVQSNQMLMECGAGFAAGLQDGLGFGFSFALHGCAPC